MSRRGKERKIAREAEERSISEARYYRCKLIAFTEYQQFVFYGDELFPGQKVVANGKYGKDLSVVVSRLQDPYESKEVSLHSEILRVATTQDLARVEANVGHAREAFALCREKIASRKLQMRLVMAHYLIGEPKLIFQYTAETRVDFRDLVKDLVSSFRARIELRHIGVRDESRLLGGIGICGREYCCRGVFNGTRSVSIKMAKDQRLSMNSLKISGSCGRLLCCLSYEHDYYREVAPGCPNDGARLMHQSVEYLIQDVNMVSQTARLVSPHGSVTWISTTKLKRPENVGGHWGLVEGATIE